MKTKISSTIVVNFESKKNFLLYFYWIYIVIIRRITSLISYIFNIRDYVEIINIVLWCAVIILSIDIFVKYITFKDLLLYFFIVLVFLTGPLIWSENYLIKENAVSYLLLMFPHYFLGKTFTVDAAIFEKLINLSRLALFVNTGIYFFIYLSNSGAGTLEDNMGFSYILLPHVLLLIYLVVYRKKNFMNSLIAAWGIILIVMQGTRGPVLLIAVFIIWCFIKKVNLKKQILLLFFGGAGILIFWSTNLFYEVIKFIAVLFEKFGVSTRILDKLLLATVYDGSGRDYIYDRIIEGIMDQKYRGYGPYGDVYLMKNDKYYTNGVYSHNVILEFLCDYGIIMGSILLIFLIVLFFKAYRKAHTEELQMFLVICFLTGFMKFFLSSSYLVEPIFYILCGISVKICTQKSGDRYKNSNVLISNKLNRGEK